MARKISRGWRRVTGLAGGIGLIGLTAVLSGVLVMSQASMGNPVFAAPDCLGPFPLGNGSEATPYIVTTSAQLDAIDTAGCLDEHFRQDADIALTGTWTPISGFVGTYDGGGNEITNLVLSEGDAGLFNVGSAGATVKNLTVRVSAVDAQTNVGAIAGFVDGPLEITNVDVIGRVSGRFGVGGLVGSSDSGASISVTNSSVNGIVSADRSTDEKLSEVGGVVGYADGPVEITNVDVIGRVLGTGASVGGLVGGANSGLEVKDSSVDVSVLVAVTGNVSEPGNVSAGDHGEDSFVGGVVGWSDGPVEITNVDVIGDVLGTGNRVGGLIGDVLTPDNGPPSTVVVSGSSVTGNVSGTGSAPNLGALVGGVIGSADSAVTISATSVIGDVSGTGDSVGGLVGDAPATLSVSGSSVTGNISGRAFIGGVVGYANSAVSISTTAVIGDVTGDVNGVGGLVGKSFVGPLTTENAFYRGTVTGGCNCFGGIAGADKGAEATEDVVGGDPNKTVLKNTYVAGSERRFVGDFGQGNYRPTYDNSFCTRATSATVENEVQGTFYCHDYDAGDRGDAAGVDDVEWLAADAQLKSQSFLEGKGWDFDNVWCVSPNVNGGYPVLRAITTPAVGFAACWAPVAVSTPAAPVASILQVTLDPNGGVCMVDGQRRDVSWSTKFVDNHYLPGNKDCEREGFTFEGWADVAKPDVVLDLPKLAQPTDGVTRPFLTRSADLIAVWKKPDETDIDTDDLTGTAPGAFVGGSDRRTREGGAVVDGYYIPPNTLFGPWMVGDDLTGTAPGAFVGGADRRTREGGGVVDGYYIPPNTVFGSWMLAR